MSGSIHAIGCVCAQTRPQVYTLIRKSLGGMESETMLTPREKSPLPDAQKRIEPRDAASRRTASPTHYRLSYSGPLIVSSSYLTLFHARVRETCIKRELLWAPK